MFRHESSQRAGKVFPSDALAGSVQPQYWQVVCLHDSHFDHGVPKQRERGGKPQDAIGEPDDSAPRAVAEVPGDALVDGDDDRFAVDGYRLDDEEGNDRVEAGLGCAGHDVQGESMADAADAKD